MLFGEDNPCPDGDYACGLVYEVTGSRSVSSIAGTVIDKTIALIGLILLALVARWLLHRLIDKLVARAAGASVPGKLAALTSLQSAESAESRVGDRRGARAKTMGSVLKSIVSVVLGTIVVITGIAELGYSIGPLLASAGIAGVAIGFGAQSLVKDFLSGIFMLFEDQYGVGDVVDLGEATGTVEGVGLRVTRLRDVNGTVWYVRNGEILRVGNQSQNWARTVLDVAVAYDEDLARVRRVLQDVAEDLWDDEDFKGVILEEPEVWGVQELAVDAITVRVVLKTAPLEQWRVARELRERIKARFDHEGIEIPFPQRVVWHRDPAGESAVTDSTDADAPASS